LVEFFVQRAGLKLPRLEAVASNAEAIESAPAVAAESAIPVPVAEAIESAPPVVLSPSAKEAEITPPVVPVPVAEAIEPAPPVVLSPSAKEAEIAPPVAPVRRPVGGVLRLREIEIVSTEASGPQRLLRSGQPLNVSLTLDLSDVAAALEDTQLSYQ